MQRRPVDRTKAKAASEGPVKPGSTLHRVLELVAKEVAKVLVQPSKTSGRSSE